MQSRKYQISSQYIKLWVSGVTTNTATTVFWEVISLVQGSNNLLVPNGIIIQLTKELNCLHGASHLRS